MITIKKTADCCGCTACASVCTHDAITMRPDALGFLYPEVDKDKCTDCGLCEKVCAFHDNYDKSLNLSQPDAYAARHKDMKEVETSRSGAAFIALSDYIIEQGGVVYGAGYADHFRVVHKRATTKEERDEFKGSKYVQSDLTGIFRQVKEDLKSGKIVLFSGTPCQTAGLNSYVGKKLRENLILVDIVCHGVPSPYVFRDYIKYLENKYKSIVSDFKFRDKSKHGWGAHIESFTIKGKKHYSSVYTKIFYLDIMLRTSCYKCHYSNINRPSDISLADYWGWERTDDKFNLDDKGCSLVLCNTFKGKSIFNKITPTLNIMTISSIEDYMQPNLRRPTSGNPASNNFIMEFTSKGISYIINKYGRDSLRTRIAKKLKTLLFK